MAIARDNAGQFGGIFQNFTGSFTCSGLNRILFVAVFTHANASDSNPTATYNGVSMTKIAQRGPTGADQEWIYLFYLINPSLGSNTIAVSLNQSLFIHVLPVSYTGAAQTGQPDNFTSDVTLTGPYTTSIIPNVNNCWVLSHVCEDGNQFDAATAAKYIPGTTHDPANPANALFDSNGPISPPANTVFTYNVTSGTANWQSITVSIAPVPPAGSTFPVVIGGHNNITVAKSGVI